MKTGVIGCGAISEIYLKNMTQVFSGLEVIACCSRHLERTRARAEQFGIAAYTLEEMLADASIELIVVLTPAPTHYELIKQALLAGKHVYTEKTMTTSLETAKELMEIAEEKGLYLGSAPDTFLGAALQAARREIDAESIGEVTSFHVSANRNLDFLAGMFPFLQMPDSGICYDYGVYHLTALVSLLGPAARVSALVKNRKPVRKNIVPGSPRFGQEYPYPNESQVMAVLEFENGVSGTFSMNGDSILEEQCIFALYGTKGILHLTDPNQFGGTVRLTKASEDFTGKAEQQLVAPGNSFAENSRGIGPAEMADAIRENRKNRASKEMAYHVLDIICQMMKSSKSGRFEVITSTCERPEEFMYGAVGVCGS